MRADSPLNRCGALGVDCRATRIDADAGTRELARYRSGSTCPHERVHRFMATPRQPTAALICPSRAITPFKLDLPGERRYLRYCSRPGLPQPRRGDGGRAQSGRLQTRTSQPLPNCTSTDPAPAGASANSRASITAHARRRYSRLFEEGVRHCLRPDPGFLRHRLVDTLQRRGHHKPVHRVPHRYPCGASRAAHHGRNEFEEAFVAYQRSSQAALAAVPRFA